MEKVPHIKKQKIVKVDRCALLRVSSGLRDVLMLEKARICSETGRF